MALDLMDDGELSVLVNDLKSIIRSVDSLREKIGSHGLDGLSTNRKGMLLRSCDWIRKFIRDADDRIENQISLERRKTRRKGLGAKPEREPAKAVKTSKSAKKPKA